MSVSAALAVFAKDMRIELRTRETISSILVFALVVAFVFNFAFEPSPGELAVLGPGIVWVAYVFTGILGLNRIFVLERDRGTLDGLLLAPVGREAIFAGKFLGALAAMLVTQALMVPVFLLLYDLALFSPWFGLVAFLATTGLAGVGTLFSALAVHTRAREVLLPLLLLPVVLPLIIAAVAATGGVLRGEGWSSVSSWVQLLVAFDVLFLVLSAWAFQFIVEE